MLYADVIFRQKIGLDKDTLTYKITERLDIKAGSLVKVPLKNKPVQGLVLNIHNKKPDFKTFEIQEILFNKPLLDEKKIEILKFIASYYFCPLRKIVKLFIPKKIFQGKIDKILKKLNEKTTEQIIRTPFKTLTQAQLKIIAEIKQNSLNKFLIHGITGSGKTEIYCRLADDYIKKGKQVLILVPEISLTPQIIEYFEKSLGIKPTVIHSKLSDTEKCEAWLNIFQNKSKIIIGSRSAIFAPFQNLELIIMDEEHELSFKQENSPRYETHKITEKFQEFYPNLKIIYGSATPKIETAEILKESTLFLKDRIGNSTLPEIEIIDMREEFRKKNFSIFSDRLKDEIANSLNNHEQILLFLNRRGNASSVVCRDCGYKSVCKNCDLPLTYHIKTFGSPALVCHHCGLIASPPAFCPNCKGVNIRFLGIGTQKIEEELNKEFPQAKVLRADRDTTSKKIGFKNIYEDFKNQKAEILVGTQMIAKGLDLPKVNLVGVVLADIGLNIPDYKTSERTFQLMTQVAGRSGRASQKGKVLIQTYNPENFTLSYIKNYDYDNFFKYEITQRKLLKYPPFSKLAKIKILNKSLKKTEEKTHQLELLLKKLQKDQNLEKELEISSYPAYLSKINKKYQYIILLKDISNTDKIHKLLEKLPKEYIIDSEIKIDIDPISIT